MAKKARRRDPEGTRRLLLSAGFEEIYKHGFQGASIDAILRRLHLTKGAFFHHFPSKRALGYAVVDEVIVGMLKAQWEDPLGESPDPLETIAESFDGGLRALASMPVNLGCPLNNLAQEMSPLDEGFRQRTRRAFDYWIRTFEEALRRGQQRGRVKKGNARAIAFSLVAQIEGILSLAKNSQDRSSVELGSKTIRGFLEGLRSG